MTAAESGAEHRDEAQREAMRKIDKAAAKGVIHKNAASRRKSRLAKRLASASAAVEG
jgi:small subunit ribosomal protein S20